MNPSHGTGSAGPPGMNTRVRKSMPAREAHLVEQQAVGVGVHADGQPPTARRAPHRPPERERPAGGSAVEPDVVAALELGEHDRGDDPGRRAELDVGLHVRATRGPRSSVRAGPPVRGTAITRTPPRAVVRRDHHLVAGQRDGLAPAARRAARPDRRPPGRPPAARRRATRSSSLHMLRSVERSGPTTPRLRRAAVEVALLGQARGQPGGARVRRRGASRSPASSSRCARTAWVRWWRCIAGSSSRASTISSPRSGRAPCRRRPRG